jgi:hypothetical protein
VKRIIIVIFISGFIMIFILSILKYVIDLGFGGRVIDYLFAVKFFVTLKGFICIM